MSDYKSVKSKHIKTAMYDNFCEDCDNAGSFFDHCPVTCLVATSLRAVDRREQAMCDFDNRPMTEDAAWHALTGE